MNNYEKYQKEYLKNYFHTESGRTKLKEAQKKYMLKSEAIEYNREKARRYYYQRKAFNDEFSRLSSIQTF